MKSRFATFGQLTAQEQQNSRTRTATGNGSPFLHVPFLTALVGVSLSTQQGRMPMPLSETRHHMISNNEMLPREAVEEPLFDLQMAGTADAIIVRSELSNNGIFQKDSLFYIEGEWADDSATNATATNTAPVASAATSITSPASSASAPASGGGGGEASSETGPASNSDSKPAKTAKEGKGAKSKEVKAAKTEDDGDVAPEIEAAAHSFATLEEAKAATDDKLKELGLTDVQITFFRAYVEKKLTEAK